MYKEDLALNNRQWLIYHKTHVKYFNNYYVTTNHSGYFLQLKLLGSHVYTYCKLSRTKILQNF